MGFSPRSDDEAAAAITRLVDGTLSDAERPEVEAWANATPEVSQAVGAQMQVKHALATGGPQAPDRLLDAVGERIRARQPGSKASVRRGETGTAGSTTRRRPAPPGGSASRWRPAIGLGAVAALAAAVAVVVIATTGTTTPTITKAARLAFVPASGPAPSVASAHYLDVSYHGVTFPNYKRLDATATGQLRNRIDGRPALTVFYKLQGGERLSYTVFSGRPLPVPSAARLTHFDGVPLRVYGTSGKLSVVTLVRHGRTCVLAAVAPQDTVLELAAEPVMRSSFPA